MPTPLEIFSGPFKAYVAAVGSTKPATPAIAPNGSWTLLGAQGEKSVTEDGVTVRHGQTVTDWFGAGETFPLKAFRSQETLQVEFAIADVTAEMYARIMGDLAVVDTPEASGVAGYRTVNLRRGLSVAQTALWIVSTPGGPYGDTFPMAYYVPRCYQGSEPEVIQAVKDTPAMLACMFNALYDPTTGLAGTLIEMDAAALP